MDLEEQIDFTKVPVGTIIPWIPRVEDYYILLPIPEGWQYCNGSVISEGDWKGFKTPDLNGKGLFLRGGDEDSLLEVEESQIQDHEHIDNGHVHSCQASSTSAPHSHTYYAASTQDDWVPPGLDEYAAAHGYGRKSTYETTVIVSTSCSLQSHSSGIGGVSSSANSGSETRPANMKVQYIIRVF